MSPALGEALGPGKFLGCAGVQERDPGVFQVGEDVFAVGNGLRILDPKPVIDGFDLRRFPAQRVILVGPGMQTSVEQRVTAVTAHLQCPEQPARPAAAFIVVGHHVRFGSHAQRREDLAEMRLLRKEAHGGFVGRDDLAVLEMHRAGDMRRAILIRLAQIHDEHIGLVETVLEIVGLDEEGWLWRGHGCKIQDARYKIQETRDERRDTRDCGALVFILYLCSFLFPTIGRPVAAGTGCLRYGMLSNHRAAFGRRAKAPRTP